MPAAGPQNTRARQRRRKPREIAGPPTPPALRQRTGAFGPLEPATAPLTRGQRELHKRTQRAQSRLPARPLPSVPILAHPTPRQTEAAKQLITHSINRQLSGTGAQRQSQRQQIATEILTDPRHAGTRRALEHYGQAEAEHRALSLARRYGVRGVPRATAVRAGRILQAHLGNRDRAAAGPAHSRLGIPGVASIDTTTLGHSLAEHLASGGAGAAAAHFLSRSAPQFGKRLGADALNLPKNAVVGLYEAGRAVNDLGGYLPGSPGKGSTKRAERLVGGLDDGFLGRLLIHGDPKGAAKALNEHPLYAALEVVGAGQVAGRVAGAGARAGLLGKALRARANTVRAPLRFGPGGAQVVDRSYSPNLLVSEVQRALERAQRKQGLDPNSARGRKQSRLLNAQVDEFAAHAEGARRRGREETARAGAKMAPVRRGQAAAVDEAARAAFTPGGRVREFVVDAKGTATKVGGSRRQRAAASADRALQRSAEASALPTRLGRARVERDVVLAAVEGRLHGPKTFARDVKAERDRLQKVYVAERKDWSAATRNANRAQVKALDRVLGDPKALANAHEVFRAAEDYKAHAGTIERDLIAQNALDPDQALASKVRPYAVAHMAARDDPTLRAPAEMAARHDAAREAEASAKVSLEHVNARVKRLASERDRIVGAQRVTRGQDAAKEPQARGGVALTRAEAKRQGEADRATRALAAAKREKRGAEARWKQARRDRVKSNPKRYATGLVDADGHRISTAQIVEHMRANPDHGGGPGELNLPGFVSHRRDTRGARSFFVNWFDRRQSVDSARRTGEATRTGAHAADFRALEEHLVRGRGVVDAIRTFDQFAKDIGAKRSNGRHYTWAGAQKVAGDMQEAHGIEMVPLRVVPARYDAATRQRILDRQGTADSPKELDSLVLRRLDEALREPPQGQAGAENVVLVPAQQLERFRQHQSTGSTVAAKLGQSVSRAFRGTVLPFSTKWLFGNVAEAVLRLGIHGITPVDIAIRGPKVLRALRALDEEKFKSLDDRARGGLLYGSGDRLNVYRDSTDFERTVLETPAKAVAAAARLPLVRQLLTGLKAYQRAVFAVNRGMEKALQTGVIGKAARKDAQELTNSWGKAILLQQDVAKQVAAGFLGTPKQVRLARMVDEILGKYGRFSPSTRRAIQTFAPFLPWYMNAARFVFHTLPVKHPAKTALLASVETTLQRDIEETHRDAPPGDLESAIRTKDGGYLPLARYTPFGAFTNLPDAVVDPLLPQISSVTQILQGRSWTGKQLRTQAGGTVTRDKRVWLALYALAEGTVPGLAIARRLQEKGQTAYDDSTVLSPKTKPGTSYGGSAASRVLNPLRPTYLAPPSGGGETVVRPARRRDRNSPIPGSVLNALHSHAHAQRQAIPESVQKALRQP